MGLKDNLEGNTLDEFNEGWDKDASTRIEADPKSAKRPNNLRRIEAYWEERRLKRQIGDDLELDDDFGEPSLAGRRRAK